MTVRDLLIEIGTEELPPKQLNALSLAFCAAIEAGLTKLALSYASVKTFATPRRLALLVHGLATSQKSQLVEKRGPALSEAFDSEGQPTRACLSFANSCGVTVAELLTHKTDKGAWLFFKKAQPGKKAAELLPQLVTEALQQLPIAKPMRWGEESVEFIRPVHWVVLLLGEELIPGTILGIPTSRQTYGHRFHCPEAIDIPEPRKYEALLHHPGHVIANYATRKQVIQEQIQHLAAAVGQAVVEENLLDEVTGLVEWPVALLGEFSQAYLELPAEVIITAMKTHQKYFAVTDQRGQLLTHFLTVSNIASRDPQRVIRGNQRVLHARLADAQFFYHSDLMHRLEYRLEALQKVIFHKKLGSLFDKAQRIAALAAYIAGQLGDQQQLAKRAGLLAKADLMTAMVGEFPELQGIMGYYYAKQDGEKEEVARAIGQHYQPRFAGDALPDSRLGCYVAIADKIDTLVGLFAAQQPPTGEKDPFGLRRAALGVLRILIEKQLPLNLSALLAAALEQYPDTVRSLASLGMTTSLGTTSLGTTSHGMTTPSFEFILERLRAWYLDRGIAPEVFAAVLARKPTEPLDIHRRIEAVQHFQTLPEAKALAAANKRVSRILRDQPGEWLHHPVNPSLLEHPAESHLLSAMEQRNRMIDPLYREAKYTEVLSLLAELRQPIDQFFDGVMVMVEDETLRNNRLALLHELQALFLQVADISLLVT